MSSDSLWSALGLTPDDRDVCALAADRIEQMKRILRNHFQHGTLGKVQLFPCPKCDNWIVDEWYTRDGHNWHKEQHVAEVSSVEEAAALYRSVFVTLKQSIYDRKTDTYSDYGEGCNFIVTGSHCTCSRCATAR